MGQRLGFLLVVPFALGVCAAGGAASRAAEADAMWSDLRAQVIRVIDGDTLQVRIGRRTARVQVIGIFAPDRFECFGPEAAAVARRLAGGKRVRLVGDRTLWQRDPTGALLAYVTLQTGQDLGRRVIVGGYARVWAKGPFRRLASYTRAEQRAAKARRGLWGACVEPKPGGSADLAVTIADASDPIVVGGRLSYRITVTNLGPDSADAVRVVVTLPAGVQFIGGTFSTSEVIETCGARAAAVQCGGSLFIVARGRTARATVFVRPTAAGTITSAVGVTSPTADPATANNTASATTTVTGSPR